MSDRIKPHFRKKMPENAIEFFSRDSDDKFKAEHPGAYRILKLAGFAAILLPLIIYVILTTIFFQQGNGWILLGPNGKHGNRSGIVQHSRSLDRPVFGAYADHTEFGDWSGIRSNKLSAFKLKASAYTYCI